jgi:hypothetical protein
MICRCLKRKIARGRDVCQACDRKSVNGPKHELACERCRDSGRIYAGTCDIPGCTHWYHCPCTPEPVQIYEKARAEWAGVEES